MTLRFLETVASDAPSYPFVAGQIICVDAVTRQHRDWIAKGIVQVIRSEEPEMAIQAPSPERAVVRRRRRP